MRPLRHSPAHKTDAFAELVCSNSLRAAGRMNAVGVLKEEMRRMNSIIMQAADHTAVPAGGALAVDREDMAREYRRFNYAHMQHHSVFDALVNRQGARAEAIMREHANATLRYAEIFSSATADARMKVILPAS